MCVCGGGVGGQNILLLENDFTYSNSDGFVILNINAMKKRFPRRSRATLQNCRCFWSNPKF